MATGIGGEVLWLCASLDDSANDLSSTGNNGSYSGGAGTVADTGHGGTRAYDLTSTKKITIPNHSTLRFGTSDWAIAFWVKASSGTESELVENQSGGVFYQIRGPRSDGTLRLQVDDDVTQTSLAAGYYLGSTWYHVVFQRDYGNQVEHYRDAQASPNTASDVTGSVSPSAGITLGKGDYAYIEDFRVFNRLLTADDRTNLASRAGFEPTSSSSIRRQSQQQMIQGVL